MKILTVITIDPDRLLSDHPKATDIEEAVAKEFGYSMSIGSLEIDDLNKVFEPDTIPPNDADLGALIRPYLEN